MGVTVVPSFPHWEKIKMPIEKTIDGRSIKFPEGYDTLEGRRRIIAKFNVRLNSQLTKKKAENCIGQQDIAVQKKTCFNHVSAIYWQKGRGFQRI